MLNKQVLSRVEWLASFSRLADEKSCCGVFLDINVVRVEKAAIVRVEILRFRSIASVPE